MADFINTIDALGDDAVIDSIIDRTITEFKDDVVTTLGIFKNDWNTFNSCKNLTKVECPNVTEICKGAFSNCTALTEVSFPLVGTVSDYCFLSCTSLISINFPLAKNLRISAFDGCRSLTRVDLPSVEWMSLYVFIGCYSLTTVILRSETIVTLAGGANVFNNCYHIQGKKDATYNPNGDKDGYIYVPRALLSDDDETKDYRRATNWTTYASQIRAIEDYPEITGG